MFPLHDANPRHSPSFVTWAFIALNVLVFVYMLSLSLMATGRFIEIYSFIPYQFFENPLANAYRLVSSTFLHAGWAHLLGNMFFLYVFGDNIEERMGHGKFALFYLLGGVVATLAHALLALASPVPLVGASGAISAVLGAYIVLYPRQRILTFIPPIFVFWLPAWLYLGYWALLQFMQGVMGLGLADEGGVAWWAHVGGFVFGLVAVRLLASRGSRL
jgi:membrane associated rhomboid family serine protease